jgi:phosphoribosylaminoimidazolecarboxamide formyltransferase/IMP cyclohydrolase
VATIALKYTQSNSVCFAYDGQVIGAGAGQQSRIHCTRLAGGKVDRWFLRQHPVILSLRWRKGIGRPERDNAIDLCFQDELTPSEEESWAAAFKVVPTRMSMQEKKDWMSRFSDVALSSDAFFPFRDCIDRAHQSGTKYVIEPGGALRDEDIIKACDDYGMVMVFSKTRLFHH